MTFTSRLTPHASRLTPHAAWRFGALCLGLGLQPAFADPPGAPLDDVRPLAWLTDGDRVSLALTSPGDEAYVVYELFHGTHRFSWSEGPLPARTTVIEAPSAPADALRHVRMQTHPSMLLVRLQSAGQTWRAPTIGVVLEPVADGGYALRRIPDAQRSEDTDPTRFYHRVNRVIAYDPEVHPPRAPRPLAPAVPETGDTGLVGGAP